MGFIRMFANSIRNNFMEWAISSPRGGRRLLPVVDEGGGGHLHIRQLVLGPQLLQEKNDGLFSEPFLPPEAGHYILACCCTGGSNKFLRRY